MYIPHLHQEECLSAVQEVRDQSIRKALVVMASGLGKTVTVAFDTKRWRERYGMGRVLFLCHNNDILYQAKTTFQAINGPESAYGYFHGEEKHLHRVDFLFASFQTMERHRELFRTDEFDYIVVDESHHSQANTFRSTIEYFRPKFLLGVTATPDRLDELDIRDIFGKEVYCLPLEVAMVRGLVTPVDYRLLTDEIQLSKVIEIGDKRISLAYLNRRIFIPKRDEEIAKIITRHVSELEKPRVIVFCNSIKHCEHLAEQIPDSFAIHSQVPDRERAVKLEMFRQGVVGTVLTVDAFNEGIDIPQANVVVFLRSTQSHTIFLQQLGRGLRKSDGKDKVLVLDFVANCERIKMVRKLWHRIEDIRHTGEGRGAEQIAPMTLNMDGHQFDETLIRIFDILDKIDSIFYPTWQEAAESSKRLGVKNVDDYREKYKNDNRLPSDPREYYDDFPSWVIFLGKKVKDFYETWQEASEVAKKLGAKSEDDYRTKYKKDPRLPFAPQAYYDDFPGWVIFLGKEVKDFYPTWQEAAEATGKLGIRGKREYHKRYQEDPRLTSGPPSMYDDFPGWPVFLGKKGARIKGKPYSNWQEAGTAAYQLSIRDSTQYRSRYKEDPRLVSSPQTYYTDFPGFEKFLKKR